ncbi:phage head closure protein [Paracoccus sp. J56]|uniref:phage head closure protein n=1 Tax=Paracoccus sp. J56 TaxID=935850 RepID=UPI000A09B9DE|nr:phage head closure protein [Paracoccus sp. J56]SMG45240.1 phage head-tail adaptor, putative, SPP1 family [Paracoccus sp. J56]
MRAGRLTNRIQIERNAVLVDDYGHARETWLPVLTCKAEIKDATTTEFLTGPGEMDNRKAVFLIRYPLAQITTADRLVMDGKAYNIVGLAEIGRRRGLELRVIAA